MDLSAALIPHVPNLRGYIAADQQTIEAVDALTCDLTDAVDSYLDLQLVLFHHGYPVTWTSFDPAVQPDQIATSLRLSLSVLRVPGADPNSTITFYAGTPGAFVDLAADLSYALEALASPGDQEGSASRDAQAGISVDDPVVPTTVESGLVGAADFSTINRAIGMLIGEGHDPDHAYTELTGRAVAAGITIVACATQLVRPAPAR